MVIYQLWIICPPFPAWKEKRTLPALRNPTNKQCHCRSPGDSESLAFHLDQPLGKQVKSTWWWWYTIQDTRVTGPWINMCLGGTVLLAVTEGQSSLPFKVKTMIMESESEHASKSRQTNIFKFRKRHPNPKCSFLASIWLVQFLPTSIIFHFGGSYLQNKITPLRTSQHQWMPPLADVAAEALAKPSMIAWSKHWDSIDDLW